MNFTENYQQNFAKQLVKELFTHRMNSYEDNLSLDIDDYNTIKYEAEKYDISLKEIFTKNISWAQFLKVLSFNAFRKNFYNKYAAKFSEFGFLYEHLSDAESKRLLLKLCAFRIFGYKKVKLPRNNPSHWEMLEKASTLAESEGGLQIDFMNAVLQIFNLKELGYDLRVHATAPGICCAFQQKQYEFHNDNVHIKAEEGDFVIDAGACWGETTMYFAHEVGEKGKVFAFEFIPSNLKVTKKNMNLNPKLKDRIEIIENPIWSTSKNKLYYVDWGPGSRVTSDKKRYDYQGTCETLSIDDLVENNKVKKIDFIKMDIEGAEPEALKGAENTIKKFKPKLAISLYHSIEDFITIPKYIASLDLGYKFYLDHHTIYQNETVMYAIVD